MGIKTALTHVDFKQSLFYQILRGGTFNIELPDQ